jgi:hypothetical protein
MPSLMITPNSLHHHLRSKTQKTPNKVSRVSQNRTATPLQYSIIYPLQTLDNVVYLVSISLPDFQPIVKDKSEIIDFS